MNADFIELLVCPTNETHRLRLDVKRKDGDVVLEGVIACADCGHLFEVFEGILRSKDVIGETVSKIKAKEMERRDIGYEKVKNYKLDLDRLAEFDAIKSAVGDCRGQWVMDAGCGVGQTTEVFSGARRGVGIDFSLQGLMNFSCKSIEKMDLIQGDVCKRYCRSELFDTIVSAQVIEHIPTHGDRLAFISQLARALKPAGLCVITVYNWDVSRRASGMSKEGLHDNGIFYHCYSASEFRDDLSREFDVQAIWGVNVYLPKTFKLVNALGRKMIYWERLWRTTKVSLDHSKLLLAVCRKRHPCA